MLGSPVPNAGTTETPAPRLRRRTEGVLAASALQVLDVPRRAWSHRQHVVPRAGSVALVIVTEGACHVQRDNEDFALTKGAALLLAKPGAARCAWRAEASGLILTVSRIAIQRAATDMDGVPRRLADLDAVFGKPLGLELAASLRCDDATHIPVRLAVALLFDRDAPRRLPIAASVKRAMDHLAANPECDSSAEALARFAGTTAATLRRNVKSCFGEPLGEVTKRIRLVWVRNRLQSPTESRSIAALSQAVGFSSATALGRAYQQAFAETPTQTRVRVFRKKQDSDNETPLTE